MVTDIGATQWGSAATRFDGMLGLVPLADVGAGSEPAICPHQIQSMIAAHAWKTIHGNANTTATAPTKQIPSTTRVPITVASGDTTARNRELLK
jgi:hypothetical protein